MRYQGVEKVRAFRDVADTDSAGQEQECERHGAGEGGWGRREGGWGKRARALESCAVPVGGVMAGEGGRKCPHMATTWQETRE